MAYGVVLVITIMVFNRFLPTFNNLHSLVLDMKTPILNFGLVNIIVCKFFVILKKILILLTHLFMGNTII